jgi:hypothetical protein
MKLRKMDRKRLERVLSNLQRGLDFIMDEQTAIMRKTSGQSTDVFTAGYYPNERYAKIAKELGSEFVLALTALYDLKRALTEGDDK